MKKIYLSMMMLAMMVAALSFTACGSSNSDEDGSGGSPSYSTFTITYDGEMNEVENTSWINPIFGNGGQKKGNYFSLDNYPLNSGQIHIIFPYDEYQGNVPPFYFTVGYNDFGEYATDIEYITSDASGWHGEYVSGSATVTKNDGKNITIQFSRYAFEVSRSGKSHTFVLDGTLTFLAYLYN